MRLLRLRLLPRKENDAPSKERLAALEAEAALARPPRLPETLYIGGGTPSELSAGQIGDLFSLLRRVYPGARWSEATFEVNPESVDAEKLAALRRGNKVLTFGNGGSACDAQNFADELVGRFEHERRSLPALALTANSSDLTAIGNDYGYDKVFSRQLEGQARRGDAAVAITTSGNSPNVISGAAAARRLGLKVIGLKANPDSLFYPLHDLRNCFSLGMAALYIRHFCNIPAIAVLLYQDQKVVCFFFLHKNTFALRAL